MALRLPKLCLPKKTRFPESGKYDLKLQNLGGAWLVKLVETMSLDLEVVKTNKKTGKNLRLSTSLFQAYLYLSYSGI